MLRFVAVAGVIVCLALVAPRFAPGIMSAALAPSAPDAGSIEDSVRQPPADAAGRRVTVHADSGGHYLVDAMVNGRPVEAMIDTGATSVALTEATARRLGIYPRDGDFTRPVSTANGIVQSAPVRLREIRVGGVVVRDVEAIVVPGEGLPVDLFGMSYLKRLGKFESAGGRLLLVQ